MGAFLLWGLDYIAATGETRELGLEMLDLLANFSLSLSFPCSVGRRFHCATTTSLVDATNRMAQRFTANTFLTDRINTVDRCGR